MFLSHNTFYPSSYNAASRSCFKKAVNVTSAKTKVTIAFGLIHATH